jgi:hypothetical protein
VKILLIILLITSCCFSENKKYAIDAGCGFSVSTGYLYFPNPSLSFYLLRETRIHELSGELYFISFKTNNGNSKVWNVGTGLSYSLLFRLGATGFFVGPTIGLYGYAHQTDTVQVVIHHTDPGDEAGLYPLGVKLAYIFGDKTIRFKIQDRFLLGFKSDYDPTRNSQPSFLNTVNACVIFAFGNKRK